MYFLFIEASLSFSFRPFLAIWGSFGVFLSIFGNFLLLLVSLFGGGILGFIWTICLNISYHFGAFLGHFWPFFGCFGHFCTFFVYFGGICLVFVCYLGNNCVLVVWLCLVGLQYSAFIP